MKKIMSLLLSLVMVASLTMPAYAMDTSSDYQSEAMALKIQQEIKETEDLVWADLYNQLAAQDALDGIEYFKEARRPRIAEKVYAKYSLNESRAATSRQYYFPNGGMVCYNGSLNTENVELCMTKEQTLQNYFSGQRVSYTDYIAIVLGFIPGLQIMTLAGTCNIILRNLAENNIVNAGYYTRLLYISWGAGAEQGCYAYGWDDHPYCYLNNDSYVVTSVHYGT